jgi:hypothetical protein
MQDRRVQLARHPTGPAKYGSRLPAKGRVIAIRRSFWPTRTFFRQVALRWDCPKYLSNSGLDRKSASHCVQRCHRSKWHGRRVRTIPNRQPTEYRHTKFAQLVIEHINDGPFPSLGSAKRINWPTRHSLQSIETSRSPKLCPRPIDLTDKGVDCFD